MNERASPAVVVFTTSCWYKCGAAGYRHSGVGSAMGDVEDLARRGEELRLRDNQQPELQTHQKTVMCTIMIIIPYDIM